MLYYQNAVEGGKEDKSVKPMVDNFETWHLKLYLKTSVKFCFVNSYMIPFCLQLLSHVGNLGMLQYYWVLLHEILKVNLI